MKPLTEAQKQKRKENAKKYYKKHRQEICARNRVKYAAKKAVKDALKTYQPINEPLVLRSNIQDVYIKDFYSKQLARIEKVLWWIAFAISFVGVAILFK